MKRTLVSVFGAFLLIVSMTLSVSAASRLPFTDVKDNAWYYDHVKTAYNAELMVGKTDTKFDPYGVMTRAEFAVIIAKIAEADVAGCGTYISDFTDAKTTAWYADYMGWGVKEGLIKGVSDTKIAPNKTITRKEIASLMVRTLTYVNSPLLDGIGDVSALPTFSDVADGAWYTDDVKIIRHIELMVGGDGGLFDPDGSARRCDMASLLAAYVKKTDPDAVVDEGLAVIHLNTETGADVTSKEEYIYTEFSLVDEDGRNIVDDHVRIRGRGNQSWKVDKKSYRLKFDENVCLMREGDRGTKNKDWVLVANHSDKSLIRNYTAQKLAAALDGLEWAPYAELVEVYLNGQYQGVYMLTEQVEVGKQRVDIEDGESEDIGFLLELDGYAEGEYNKDFFAIEGRKYTVKSDFKSTDQVIAMKLHLEAVLNILREGDKEKVEKYIDLDSAIDMFIVYELMRNLDVGWSSFYMYFYEPYGKLYFGPTWDFDLSGGNSYNCYQQYGPYAGNANEWFGALLAHEWIRELVKERLLEVSDTLVDVIDRSCEYAYVNMETLDKNFVRWDIFDELINQEPTFVMMLKSCTAQVEYLETWLGQRHGWMMDFYTSEDFTKYYHEDFGVAFTVGRTETLTADTWVIPDWFTGDKMAQVMMDILYPTVETHDGRIILDFGKTSTLTCANFTRLILVDQLGAPQGKYMIVIDDAQLAAVKAGFQGLGYGQCYMGDITFKIKDLETGEESLPATHTFELNKRLSGDQYLG